MEEIIKCYQYLHKTIGFNLPDWLMIMIVSIFLIILLAMFFVVAYKTLSPIFNWTTNKREINKFKKLLEVKIISIKTPFETDKWDNINNAIFSTLRILKSNKRLLKLLINKTGHITEEQLERWTKTPLKIPTHGETGVILLEAYVSLINIYRDNLKKPSP